MTITQKDRNGKVLVLYCSEVKQVLVSTPDTYSAINPELVKKGIPEKGNIQEFVFQLKDGTALVINAVSQEEFMVVHDPALDAEALTGVMCGEPLPTTAEIAEKLVQMGSFEEDVDTEDDQDPEDKRLH